MKLNPYLPALMWLSILLLVVGVVAFIVALGNAANLAAPGIAVGATGLAGLTFPLGALGFLLWLTACAIAWRPADEPPRKS